MTSLSRPFSCHMFCLSNFCSGSSHGVIGNCNLRSKRWNLLENPAMLIQTKPDTNKTLLWQLPNNNWKKGIQLSGCIWVAIYDTVCMQVFELWVKGTRGSYEVGGLDLAPSVRSYSDLLKHVTWFWSLVELVGWNWNLHPTWENSGRTKKT